jgi:hypothetical protein
MPAERGSPENISWFLHLYVTYIVAYLLIARTVEPEKQPLLGNVRTQQQELSRYEMWRVQPLLWSDWIKHVSSETNSRNNRKAVLSVRSVPRGYEKDKEDRLSQLSL